MTIEKLQSVFTKKGYKWDSNLNIIGVRNKTVGNKITNKFDDTMYVAYKEAGAWKVKSYAITTDPTKEGFEFNGWYNGETLFNFTTPITANITLTADWLEVFTVTFDSQGGSAVTAQDVTDGDVATEPTPAPTKADNTFQHWSLTENGEAYSFATEVTEDITLYAIWLAD